MEHKKEPTRPPYELGDPKLPAINGGITGNRAENHRLGAPLPEGAVAHLTSQIVPD